ncbi:thiol-disulfide oxidoreductase DCC family protein [Streptomyces sp. KR80]|uniref:thiol-disulfide oxidoreductase DCC family protein n=1 Tax=Streptomyces sp. KR80 TaxID=3457426 RepID=UPI003FD0A516
MSTTGAGRGTEAPALPAAASSSPTPAAVRRLTVLHDPGCPLCRHLSDWLRRQRQLVPLEFVAVGSDEARERFPGIDQTVAYREITVVGDGGQVWTGHAAFVVCLWALAAHRPLAHRLSTPAGLPFARGAALAAAKYRAATSAKRRSPGSGTTSPWQGWGGDSWGADLWPGPPEPPGCDGRCPAPD